MMDLTNNCDSKDIFLDYQEENCFDKYVQKQDLKSNECRLAIIKDLIVICVALFVVTYCLWIICVLHRKFDFFYILRDYKHL